MSAGTASSPPALRRDSSPSAPPPARPYPGLRPFDRGDAPVFFGRAAQTAELLNKLEDNRFVAVVGSSGSGKSSLVRAGLRPAIERGLLFGIPDMQFAVMKPNDSPFQSLAEAFAALLPGQPASMIAAEFRNCRGGLANALARLGLPEKTNAVIVVDQFEELFAFRRPGAGAAASRAEASLFVALLLATAAPAVPGLDTEPDKMFPGLASRLWIVLTMRSDFIGDCEAFPGLPEAVSQSQFLVPRLDRRQMTEAITGPGTVQSPHYAPFKLDPVLAARIIADAGDRIDQLPLVQHALLRTWKTAVARRASGSTPLVLTMADYLDPKVGGIGHALSRDADAALHEFTHAGLPDETAGEEDAASETETARLQEISRREDIVRRLFMLLCDISPEGHLLRHRPLAGEAAAVAGCDLAAISAAVFAFQRKDRCFITAHPEGMLAESTVLSPASVLDVSHETLLRQWTQMSGATSATDTTGARGWVAREAAARKGLLRLKEDYSPADQSGKPPGLLEGAALARTLEWKKTADPGEAWAARYLEDKESSQDKDSPQKKLQLPELLDFLERSRIRQIEIETAKKIKLAGLISILAAAFIICLVAWKLASKARGEAEEAAGKAKTAAEVAESARIEAETEIVRGCADSLGRSGDLEPLDMRTIWRLAETPARQHNVRTLFLERLYGGGAAKNGFPDISELERLQQWEPQLFRAAAGIGADARAFRQGAADDLANRLIAAGSDNPGMLTDELGTLTSTLLAVSGKLPGDKKPLANAVITLTAAMRQTTDAVQLSSMAAALSELAKVIPGDKKFLLDAAERLVEVMKQAGWDGLPALTSALADLEGSLPGDKKPLLDGAMLLVAAMKKEKPASPDLPAMGQMLARLSRDMPGDKQPVQEGAVLLAAAMANEQLDIGTLGSLAFALGILSEEMPGDKQPLQDGAVLLAAAMAAENETDADTLEAIASALARLGRKMPGEKKPLLDGAIRLMEVMQQEASADACEALGRALASLAGAMTGTLATDCAARLEAALKESSDSTEVAMYAAALSQISAQQPEIKGFVLEGAKHLMSVMTDETEAYTLELMGSALAALCDSVPESSQDLAARVAALMQPETDPVQLSSLGSVLCRLAPALTADKKPLLDAAAHLISAMEQAADTSAIDEPGSVLASLAPFLSEDPAFPPLVARLTAAMQREQDAAKIGSLGSALAKLADTWKGSVRPPFADGASALADAMARPGLPADILVLLSRPLAALADQLPAEKKHLLTDSAKQVLAAMEQSADSAEQVLAAMEQSADTGYSALGGALAGLGAKLPAGDIPEIEQRVMTWGEKLLARQLAARLVMPHAADDQQPEPRASGRSVSEAASLADMHGVAGEILSALQDSAPLTAAGAAFACQDLARAVHASDKKAEQAHQFSPPLIKLARTTGRTELLKFAVAHSLLNTNLHTADENPGQIAPVPAPAPSPLESPERMGNMRDDVASIRRAFAGMISAPPLKKDDLVEILQYPLCVGEAEKIVLAELERNIGGGAKFDGDIWKFIEQAPALELKVDDPAVRPDGAKIIEDLEKEYQALKKKEPKPAPAAP